jgi:choline kinase
MSGTKTAVVLAAGRGERLRPLTDQIPKQMIRIGGMPIIGRMLSVLQTGGIEEFVIVTGYRERVIRDYVSKEFESVQLNFVRNEVYETTNTLWSLALAEELVKGRPFFVLDGDLLFSEALVRPMLRDGPYCHIACDRSIELDDEAVRAYGTQDGRVLRIGKSISEHTVCFGEAIGFGQITASVSVELFRTSRYILHEDAGRMAYYEAAFQKLIDAGVDFRAVDIAGERWAELDTPGDLARAETLFGDTEEKVMPRP